MRNVSVCLIATLSALSSLVGCGAAAPSAAPVTPVAPSPRASTAAPHTAAAAAPAALSAEEESTPAAAASSEEKPQPANEERDGLRKASRPPLDLLTGNNVVYVLNFADSAKGEAAKQQCEGQADVAAARECLAAERSKIPVESVRFVKDEHGQYWWVTYNRYKGNLLKWHKLQFLPGKEDADTIHLTLVGKDKGIAPMGRVPASLKVELPNDYSIVVSDPELGNMVFDAKIGMMDRDSN